MKTLTIKDLTATAELDAKAMAAVSGGMFKAPYWGPLVDIDKSSFKFDAEQSIGQSQNTLVNNGNNAAFVAGITSNVKPTQTANNTINFV